VTGFRLPLALSLAAHAAILALLFVLPAPPPAAAPAPTGGIEVTVASSLPQPPAPAPAQPAPPPLPPPPPPQAETPPPPVPPPPAAEAATEADELVPPPKPPVPPAQRPPPLERALRTRPRELPQRPQWRQPAEEFRPAFAAVPAARYAAPAPSRQAALEPAAPRAAAAAPSATVSPGYAALLGAWLNSHKRYPESAREHGEQGRVVLHFGVERSGRVTEFAVVGRSGYADLDAAVEEMMRGAILPGFPPDMPQRSVSVSVTIRFSLEE
jgi:periplasmic protein TonB